MVVHYIRNIFTQNLCLKSKFHVKFEENDDDDLDYSYEEEYNIELPENFEGKKNWSKR